MNNLQHLADWVDPLLDNLTAQQRRKLLKKLITQLRRNNQRRIAQQKEPGGDAFTPRKNTQDSSKLFPKLRKSRFIKIRATPDSGVIFFSQRAARIAAMHHYGLLENHANSETKIKNTPRPLLGFSPADVQLINDFFVENLP